jgi:hypothetical protein
MKNVVFWDVMSCDSCKNRRFGGEYRLHHHGLKNRRARKNVSNNHKPKSGYEAIHSSEMSVRTTATWRQIPEDGILLNKETSNSVAD